MVYKNFKKNIFEDLKLSIIRGAFNPRERLIERELAERYGVSRTPIREAIRKLESLGMVRIIPHQGARVADFSLQEINALYEVRISLEKLAGKLGCARHSSQELKRLVAINHQLIRAVSVNDFRKMVEYDQKFHLTLLAFSKNPFLMRFIEELRLKCYPISYYFWRSKTNLRSSLTGHRNMIKALRQRDSEGMTLLTDKLLNDARNSYLAHLSRTQRVDLFGHLP